MRIGLIPLDERPVNTRYPAMIARIAGAEVLLPPREALSDYRTPAPAGALETWLRTAAPTLDALIVSIEMLGYGGLIASRITHEPAETILARLDILRALDCPVYGFNLITRISRHNDATEEPAYWADYGVALFRLSQGMDRAGRGEPVERELAELRAAIPPEHVQDFLTRRERNHRVNRAVLDLLAEGGLDLLVLSSDDTSDYGLSTVEKRQLAQAAAALGVDDRLLMYPGADEVGCVLVARLVNLAAGRKPRVHPVYLVPGGGQVIAAFEDGPVQITVERQIRAANAVLADSADGADILLLVNPPLDTTEWIRPYTPAEEAVRVPPLKAGLDEAARVLAAGRHVAVADVAHANGADGTFFALLKERLPLDRLAAYAAWNTAGNTIGTVIAQSCAALSTASEDQRLAHRTFLAHRYLEDWAYQRIVRQEASARLEAGTGRREPTSDDLRYLYKWIERRLQEMLASLPGFAGAHLTPGSVRLPWQRTFEIDFDLEL